MLEWVSLRMGQNERLEFESWGRRRSGMELGICR